jgi:Na+-translocating ferredoxin:NAD+ oxidoreductase RNF subunit RnfB
MSIFIKSILVFGGLGLGLGILLALMNKKLAITKNIQLEKIMEALPGSNCGICGFPGCEVYAEKIVKECINITRCLPGEQEVVLKIARILGQDVKIQEPLIAVLTCQGGKDQCHERFIYDGGTDCRQAYILHGGNKSCVFGCVGFGHCALVCPFGAIKIADNHLPVIDEKKCTGCGICVKECPKKTLRLIPCTKLVYLACVSKDKGNVVRNICTVGCYTCNICVKVCPYQALKIENNLPVMEATRCTDCGICVRKCPVNSFIDRAKARPYAMITSLCNGCSDCKKVCQFNAIEGNLRDRHKVIIAKCIGCGECFKICPVKAIKMAGALGHQG